MILTTGMAPDWWKVPLGKTSHGPGWLGIGACNNSSPPQEHLNDQCKAAECPQSEVSSARFWAFSEHPQWQPEVFFLTLFCPSIYALCFSWLQQAQHPTQLSCLPSSENSFRICDALPGGRAVGAAGGGSWPTGRAEVRQALQA